MLLVSTRAFKGVAEAFTYLITVGASLASIGRIDIDNWEAFLQRLKSICLFFCDFALYTDGRFHWVENMPKKYFEYNFTLEEQRFLPALKDGISALSLG